MYKIAIIFNKKNIDFDFDLSLSYPKDKAIEIVKKIRSLGGHAELYPEKYNIPHITEENAYLIAFDEYNNAKLKQPNNFGELVKSERFHPMWYIFYARDYQKEEDGMTPGLLTIRVDKLSGGLISWEEDRQYRLLNDSF